MTVRTTGGSPAPPRRRADPFGPPPSTSTPPTEAGGGTPDETLDDGTPLGSSARPSTSAPGAAEDPAPGRDSGVEEPVEVARETRREVREARHRRRQLMVACAVVVAACLVLTILIVTMARQRPSGLPVQTAPRAEAVATYRSAPVPTPNHGAVAPQGGHH
jgi:hypothetical protein